MAKVWPNPFVKLCEHHLRAGAIKAMRPYGRTGYGQSAMALLNDAFRGPAGWKAFKAGVKGIGIDRWLQSYDLAVRDQTKRRAKLPDHHSTDALDEALAKVREFIGAPGVLLSQR